MRDKTHMEQVERWARFVKSNSNWKKIHTKFINAQYEKAEEFIKRLSKEKGGSEKIIKLYGIKNKKGYEKLLGSAKKKPLNFNKNDEMKFNEI